MNSFKNVKKYIYNTDQNEFVKLLEYAICTNENDEKFIVFKFKNLIVQDLYAITFKISQYNSEQVLLKTSSIAYDGFLAHSGEEFVPNAKYQALEDCETIIIELEEAVFEKMRYRYGICTDIILDEEKLMKTKDAVTNTKKKKPTKVSKRVKKYKYKIKTQRKLRSKFTLSTTIFLSLLLIGFVVYGAIRVQQLRYPFLYQSVLYEEMSDGTLSVVGYDGKSKKIEIPAIVNEKSVSIIKSDAFANNDTMSELVINADRLIIDTNSFTNCSSLDSITISGEATIHSYAFKDCLNLKNFEGSSTNIDECAFENDMNFVSFVFKGTGCRAFGDVFGVNNRLVPNIARVSFDIPIVSGSFLRNIPQNYSKNYENRSEKAIYEKDYEANGFKYYVSNNYAYIYDYNLLSSNIEIPESLGNYKVNQIDAYAFYKLQCRKIKISSNIKLESCAISSCYNLREIEIVSSDLTFYSDSFDNCDSIKTFSAKQLKLNDGILANLTNLERLEFKTTTAKTLGFLFGLSNNSIIKSLKYVYIESIANSKAFLENIDTNSIQVKIGQN